MPDFIRTVFEYLQKRIRKHTSSRFILPVVNEKCNIEVTSVHPMVDDRSESGEADMDPRYYGETRRSKLSRVEYLLGNLAETVKEHSQRMNRVETTLHSKLHQAPKTNDNSVTKTPHRPDVSTTAEIHFSEQKSADHRQGTASSKDEFDKLQQLISGMNTNINKRLHKICNKIERMTRRGLDQIFWIAQYIFFF